MDYKETKASSNVKVLGPFSKKSSAEYIRKKARGDGWNTRIVNSRDGKWWVYLWR